MSAFNSPMLVNHPLSRRQYDYASPPNRWGAPAGRLSYISPMNISAQLKGDAVTTRTSQKGVYSSSDESLDWPRNPINYGSPIRSPAQLTLDASTDSRSRTYSDFADNSNLIASGIARMVQDDSTDISSGGRSEGTAQRLQARTTLPVWTLDNAGQVKLTLAEVLQYNQLKMFARDKLGCQFLQQHFPSEGSEERILLCKQVLENEDVFEALCSDVFGNFFVQRLIETANISEQRWISTRLLNKMNALCLNRYSCRVVQKAIEQLPLDLKGVLLVELHTADIVRLSVDQNANHVIQKIMHSFPLANWSFLVEALIAKKDYLFAVAENKYGCRVVQLAVEMLSNQRKSALAEKLLKGIMIHITEHCDRLAANEFANYVIQHIITAGALYNYRDKIIEECILRNILSMAQEKYASHVVEKALEFAPDHLLKEMMDEIFEGYVPHPETRKDALDIMIFHQYGNYVVQRMLSTCIEAARARISGIKLRDMDNRLEWLQRLKDRIQTNEAKLSKYSSGKKILDMMADCPCLPRSPLDSLPNLAATLSATHGFQVPAVPHKYM